MYEIGTQYGYFCTLKTQMSSLLYGKVVHCHLSRFNADLCKIRAPFGFPVLPEVYKTANRRSLSPMLDGFDRRLSFAARFSMSSLNSILASCSKSKNCKENQSFLNEKEIVYVCKYHQFYTLQQLFSM